jgi:hypothetical protein
MNDNKWVTKDHLEAKLAAINAKFRFALPRLGTLNWNDVMPVGNLGRGVVPRDSWCLTWLIAIRPVAVLKW